MKWSKHSIPEVKKKKLVRVVPLKETAAKFLEMEFENSYNVDQTKTGGQVAVSLTS